MTRAPKAAEDVRISLRAGGSSLMLLAPAMHPTLLQAVLWILGPLLQFILAVVIIHRRLVKEIPIFWGYTVFHVLLAVTSYAASRVSYRAYFDVYWGAEVLDMVLALLVIQELFSHAFAPYEAIRALGRILFRSAALIMIIFSILLATSGTSSGSISPLVDRFVSLERSVHVLGIGVLFVLFLVCRIFGIIWQRFAFGIAIGMGLTLSGEAIAAAARAFLGPSANQLYVWLEPVSYTLATAIWAYYAISVDREAELSSATPSPTQLAEWNRALEHLVSRS